MKSVRVDPDAKSARVEPRVVLDELDQENGFRLNHNVVATDGIQCPD